MKEYRAIRDAHGSWEKNGIRYKIKQAIFPVFRNDVRAAESEEDFAKENGYIKIENHVTNN